MKTKLLFIFMICAFYVTSALAQIPTPVIGLAFEDNVDDAMGTISPVAYNVTYENDATRGSKVIVFNGAGNGETVGAGTNDSASYVDVTTVPYSYSALTINLWFNCDVVETWSRLYTFGTFGTDHHLQPEAWVSPANGRGSVIGPDGVAAAGQLAFSAGTSDANAILHERGAGVIEANTWYMVTITHDAESSKVYLDGDFMTGDTIGAGPSDLTFAFGYLGVGPWPDAIFDGKMDNFTVYDKVLTDAEITALFECTEGCIVGIEEPLSSFKPVVYSSNGLVYIQNANNVDINTVQIYNMVGKLVFQTNEFNEVISPNLPSSIYILKVQSNKGDFVQKVSLFK